MEKFRNFGSDPIIGDDYSWILYPLCNNFPRVRFDREGEGERGGYLLIKTVSTESSGGSYFWSAIDRVTLFVHPIHLNTHVSLPARERPLSF